MWEESYFDIICCHKIDYIDIISEGRYYLTDLINLA